MILLPLVFAAATAAQPPLVSAERIREDVRVLASDAFEGRGPGEAGEVRTIEYLTQAFAAAGLEPGGVDGLWTHPVPLVRLERSPGAALSLSVSGKRDDLAVGDEVTLGLRNPGRTEIHDAPLVFGGYGVVDASLGWDDYEGVDLRGKVVLLLANDPDYEAGQDLGFEGRRMVLSGRVGTKFAAAARAGALGALVIHEDAAASYPFSQVASGDALPAFSPAPLQPSTLQFSGWLRRDVALQLLHRTGLELETLKRQARDRSFRAFPMRGVGVSASGELRATDFTSHNVLARLRGASRPDEYVLYGAHWDANGRNGPDGRGDTIRNGAVDNATGTAEVLEIARAFARGPRPERTVVFAAWTAEEKGLLGADHYAANPIYPLNRTVAVINLDPHVVLPAARNVELIGGGRTNLEERLTEAASSLGLRVSPEPNPEAGWYFRSDHFPFARRGVPALAFRAGRDLVDGGLAAGNAAVEAYNAHDYHQTTDEFHPDWTFAGTALEARVAYRLGLELANSEDWPSWYAGVEYGRLRTEAPPAAESAGPAPAVQTSQEDVLGRAIRAELGGAWEANYFAARVDLNADGSEEVVAYVAGPMVCGTGGCPVLVLKPSVGGYSVVSRISVAQTPVRVSPRSANGWRNLVVGVGGGGMPAGDAELEFDGTSYVSNPTVPPAKPLADSVGTEVLVGEFQSYKDGTPVPVPQG